MNLQTKGQAYKLTDFSVAPHLKPNSEKRTRGSHPFKFVVPRAKKIALSIALFFDRVFIFQRKLSFCFITPLSIPT